MEKREIIYFRESLFQSICADLFSYGMLVGSFWLNIEFIGSKLLSAILLIMFFMMSFSKAMGKAKKFYSKQDLIEYLKEPPHETK